MNGNLMGGAGPADGGDDAPTRGSEESGGVFRRQTQLSEERSDIELLQVRQELRVRRSSLPPSEDFASYENTVPGAGDRILSMAERRLELVGRDRELRHAEFIRVVETNAATERWGQGIAGVFIVTMTVVWGVIMLSDVEEKLKIASMVFPAVIAGANAYRTVRRMWKNDPGPSDGHRGDKPSELESAPTRGHAERD